MEFFRLIGKFSSFKRKKFFVLRNRANCFPATVIEEGMDLKIIRQTVQWIPATGGKARF